MLVSCGARTVNQIAGTPAWEIRTGATPGRAKIMELGFFLAEATASTIYLGRPQEIGINPVSVQNFLPEDPNDVIASGVIQSTVDWGSLTVEDCTDVWDETTDADIVCSVDGTRLKFVVGAGATAGDITTEVIGSTDFSTANFIRLKMECSVSTSAGDLQIMLDDTASCASPVETLDVPALAAGVEKEFIINLANPASDTAIISVGVKYTVDIGACTFYIDNITAEEDPKVPSNALRRISLPGTIGTGVIWTFPEGLTVPVSDSIVLWNETDGALMDVYAVIKI